MALIIDVGAHNGSCLAIPSAKDSTNLVYAIEPIPALADSIRSHHLPNLFVFNLAIGEQEGSATFYLNFDDQTSSLLEADPQADWSAYEKQLERVESISVEVKRLDSFLSENSITEVDLLKVDAQGADLQVLKSAGDLIHNIKRIQVEVQLSPLYVGSADKTEIVNYLTSRGFRLALSQPQTEGLEENLDFVRSNRYREAVEVSDNPSNVYIPYVGCLEMPPGDLVGHLLEESIFESAEQAFVWLYLRPEDTFFDCGAHAGLFSCIAAKTIRSEGRIVGFEPNPTCISLYERNVRAIGFENAIAMNVGLSDVASESAKLRLGRKTRSAFSTFADEDDEDLGDDYAEIEQTTLDHVISTWGIERVDLAKLDVEGWESRVIKGASQAIKRGVFPIWMIEFTEKNALTAGTSTRQLADLIESYGYTLCQFDATQLQLVPEKRQSYYEYKNLFAVLDIESANRRLMSATKRSVYIAKDIVHRWDLAVKAVEFEKMLPAYEVLEKHCQLRLNVINDLTHQLEIERTRKHRSRLSMMFDTAMKAFKGKVR